MGASSGIAVAICAPRAPVYALQYQPAQQSLGQIKPVPATRRWGQPFVFQPHALRAEKWSGVGFTFTRRGVRLSCPPRWRCSRRSSCEGPSTLLFNSRASSSAATLAQGAGEPAILSYGIWMPSVRRASQILETGVPGVVAVDGSRSGNVKWVAAAVGEGAIAVQVIHQGWSAPAPRAEPGSLLPASENARGFSW